jgi:hypothetical protein
MIKSLTSSPTAKDAIITQQPATAAKDNDLSKRSPAANKHLRMSRVARAHRRQRERRQAVPCLGKCRPSYWRMPRPSSRCSYSRMENSPKVVLVECPGDQRPAIAHAQLIVRRSGTKFADSPLEERVSSEPVSASQFPGNRVKYREFRRFRSYRRLFGSKRWLLPATCEEIPWTNEQGIFLVRSGKSTRTILVIREYRRFI